MKFVTIVLNNPDKLEEVIQYFVEMGVGGATIVDSVGMGKILAYDIPIFAGFRDIMVGARANNKTIMTTVADEILEEFMEGLDHIINFSEPGSGVAFVIDVFKTYGIGRR